MLNKSDTMNFVSSCTQISSVMLPSPVGKVYEMLKTMNFSQIFPSVIKSLKFTSGSPNEVGSMYDVEFQDGHVWTMRMVEISEVKRSFSWEMISASPKTPFSSMLCKMKMSKVTADNTTFLKWKTSFSSDVDAKVLKETCSRRMEEFRDLMKMLA